MAGASISVDHDQFSCPVCLDLLKDPVTINCGHSFCMVCINGYWDQEDQRGVYSCPQCRQTFTPRPVLRRNTMLAEVVEKLKETELQAAPPAPRYAGPGDVECDFCTGRKLKAIKSCLTCLASFCETHLKRHYEVPALKKHRLVEASSQLQEKICSQHNKPIKSYCRTDQRFICYLCMMEEHKGHDTVPAGNEIPVLQSRVIKLLPRMYFPPQQYSMEDTRMLLLYKLWKEDLKVFQRHLTKGVEGFSCVPKALLKNADIFDTVDQMIWRYGHNEAVEITLAILKMMDQHHLSDEQSFGNEYEVPASWTYIGTKPASPQWDDKHPYKVADIREVLLDTIDELRQSDLKRFQWHLSNHVEGFSWIPRGPLENADRFETVDQMIERYGHSGAVEITLAILKKMNQNHLSEELRTKIQPVKEVPASWSYSDTKPASPQRDDKHPHNMSDIRQALLYTIDRLRETDLRYFHWCLTNGVKGFPAIRKALENADRPETVDEMIQRYGHSGAVEVTVAILEMMNQRQLSKELKTKIEYGPSRKGDGTKSRADDWTWTKWTRDWTEGTRKDKPTFERKEVPVDDDGDSELASLQSDTKDPSLDVEPFDPDVVENSQGFTTTYRFLCPHAGHFRCTVTNLVFEMEGEGEVLYRIDSWDIPKLDGLGQMKPGGPLYNIECFEGSISHLHLPHCEILSEENKVKLAVAHFIKDNIELIPPLQVTSTHVIIHIQGLFPLGIIRDIRDLLFNPPVSAQVLLFYQTVHNILYIHLLPKTVPVKDVIFEVKKINECIKYIQTTSTCQLTPGRKYKPSCDPYDYQPQDGTFEWDFGPNYHPAFEVLLDSTTENVRIGLLDEYDRKVWDPRCVFLKANSTDAASHGTDEEAAEFVDGHRETLIQRVSSVMEIADRLRSKKMMGKEMYDETRREKTPQKQMRKLYDVLDSGGTKVKAEFYKVLKEKLQSLVDELEDGT